jgi:hypothetical protein
MGTYHSEKGSRSRWSEKGGEEGALVAAADEAEVASRLLPPPSPLPEHAAADDRDLNWRLAAVWI